MTEIHDNFTVVSEHDFVNDPSNVTECQQTKARALDSVDHDNCSYINENIYITNSLASGECFQVSNIISSSRTNQATNDAKVTDALSPGTEPTITEDVRISMSETDPPITPFSPTGTETPAPVRPTRRARSAGSWADVPCGRRSCARRLR